LPPFGPVDTISVVLWFAKAVPEQPNATPTAATATALIPLNFPPKQPGRETGNN